MKRLIIAFASICCVVLGWTACSENSADTASTSISISASGGFVQTETGTRLTVPENAVSEEVTITVQTTSNAATEDMGVVPANEIHEFLPAGTVFEVPALVTMTYDPTKVTDPSALSIWWSDSKEGPWVQLETTIDEENATASANVEHFSFGVVGTLDPTVNNTICSDDCMAQEGAVCCSGCGCSGEIQCDPECPSPYTWDCEMQCCFDYDYIECMSDELSTL